MRKLVGNSVAIPCVTSVIRSIFKAVEESNRDRFAVPIDYFP